MISFEDILKEYAENHVVYICENPDEVLKFAKEHNINITVMSYNQATSVMEFKYPVTFDSYEGFVKYLFPVFDFYDI